MINVLKQLVRTTTDIELWPIRLEYYHDQCIKTTGKRTRIDIEMQFSLL